MWNPKGGQKRGAGNGLVVVAIDKDKGSQNALRWAVEHLLSRGQAVVLIHVTKPTYETSSLAPTKYTMALQENRLLAAFYFAFNGAFPSTAKNVAICNELLLSFHVFCTRKDIQCLDIILEDTDVVKALTEYVSHAAIEKLVLGAASTSGFMRKFRADIPSCVTKGAPDFCTVYTISKGKVLSLRNASRSAPFSSPLIDQIRKLNSNFSDPNLINAAVKAGWFLSKTTFKSLGSH
ncbi:hypothetical protein GOBAR_AA29360 [Gossypium barbadense]|uniref:RING-type E3 ubiquitin transferase n=1 Tax=Gossypium barbadense TaxID=3634 RepID=A0A2P5WJP9_GOSBA|nr:hypothetical protein GOBAR_AA29360 [Gossypium barbadense]